MRFLGLTIEQWTAITNALLTFGLLVFAGVQVWLTHKAEETRAKEEKEKEKRAMEEAFAVAWAEYWRLYDLARDYQSRDLVLDSGNGLLAPSDFLVADPSHLSERFGRLGRATTRLGSAAITHCAHVAGLIAAFNQEIAELTRKYGRVLTADEIGSVIGAKRLDTLIEEIRAEALEAALILVDALRAAPGFSEQVEFELPPKLGSRFALNLQANRKEREIRSARPPPGGDHPRGSQPELKPPA
jgi:hypothetical protein